MSMLAQIANDLSGGTFPVEWHGHLLAGVWTKTQKSNISQTKSSINPSTGLPLVDFSVDKNALGQALDAAEAARNRVGDTPLVERIEILRRFRQGLADYQRASMMAMQLEAGKPAWEANAEIEAAIRHLDWVADRAGQIFSDLLAPARLGRGVGDFRLNPIGVTVAYLPFSSPVSTFAFYFSAAVVAGCPMVLVTSTHAVLSGMLFGALFESLGLPKDRLSIVFGNFNVFKPALADRRVAAVLYTGSREHCDLIRAESRNIPGRQLVLQSGGKNAVIVHQSADLDLALRCVVHGTLRSTGQLCTSTSRVMVHKDVSEEFNTRLVELVRRLPVGPTDRHSAPDAGAPYMGPLYSDKAVQKFLRFQTMANREAKETLLWGKALESNAKGFFVSPGIHLMERFDNSTAYQGNVLFGPDIAIYEYDTLEDAIGKVNTTDATFAVSFMGDPKVIEPRRRMVLAPNLLVNLPTVEIEATLPLAGRLQSGHHRYHGPGIALYLCYPQVLQNDDAARSIVASWPWPSN